MVVGRRKGGRERREKGGGGKRVCGGVCAVWCVVVVVVVRTRDLTHVFMGAVSLRTYPPRPCTCVQVPKTSTSQRWQTPRPWRTAKTPWSSITPHPSCCPTENTFQKFVPLSVLKEFSNFSGPHNFAAPQPSEAAPQFFQPSSSSYHFQCRNQQQTHGGASRRTKL